MPALADRPAGALRTRGRTSAAGPRRDASRSGAPIPSGGSGRGFAEAGTRALRPAGRTGEGGQGREQGGVFSVADSACEALGRVTRRSMGPERHHHKWMRSACSSRSKTGKLEGKAEFREST